MNQIKGGFGELSCEYEKSLGFRRTDEEVIVLLPDSVGQAIKSFPNRWFLGSLCPMVKHDTHLPSCLYFYIKH